MATENRICNTVVQPTMRLTRSRAKTLAPTLGLPPIYPSARENRKPIIQAKSKRGASDEDKPNSIAKTSLPHKKRGGLKDVTNLACGNSYSNCIRATKIQPIKQEKKGLVRKNIKSVPAVNCKKPRLHENVKENTMEERKIVKIDELQGINSLVDSEENNEVQISECISMTDFQLTDLKPVTQNFKNHIQMKRSSEKEKAKQKEESDIVDIDSKDKDPRMCSMYAPDIYQSLQAMELDQRPCVNYMKKMQHDITPGMRGILVDWLVEVCEEYRLVPDTLYLTVSLIDRFLSDNFIEKQKLQLLGITCTLIASKYEEICAPRVEELCFITDNTYSKEEVVRMESLVLNFLGFRLSRPTTKKFLRRFIQAAQVSYKVPSIELEFLANYLAELTLLDYNFLKFVPSRIAASAVFLAKWTLDQSDNPWNCTLEYYTTYKSSQLEATVLALQDLQLNNIGCNLKAVRAKYGQSKFKSVATLTPSKPVQSLFSESG